MKNYKKGLLTLAILSTMSLMAADDKTIYVTTFDDEDGENMDKCSLREAVQAATTHKAYGGCSAGQQFASVTNIIQLEAGEYKLKKELRPDADLIIQGKAPADYSKVSVLTNTYPALTEAKTTISAQGQSRIFNTIYGNKPALALNNIVLKDATSKNDVNDDKGGAIYAGGALTLNNVSIQNATSKMGGAIYLNGTNSGLKITNGTYQKNNADQGSVVAMSCNSQLGYTTLSIDSTAATYIDNGSANSSSVFSLCGQPTVTFTANTLTQNTANPSNGSIIQFSKVTPQGNTDFSVLSNLLLISNTIVQNSAASTLLYGQYGNKVLTSNILAYNTGKSCRYTDGDITQAKNVGIVALSNALMLQAVDGQCDLPEESKLDNKDKTLDISGVDFSTLLSSLQPASEYTSFMPMYFPVQNNNDKDLVDVGYVGCSGQDQRGITRVIAGNSNGENQVANSCDIGATELLRLTANNLSATNTDVVALIASYQKELDIYNGLLANKTTNPDYLPFYKIQADLYSTWIKYTKSDQKYRTIFIDPFIANLPDEEVTPDGGRKVIHLSTDNYDVSVKVLGVGMLNDQGQFVNGSNIVDPNLHCEWNPNLKKIMMWRTDDSITPTGDSEFCSYTLTTKNITPAKSSSAYLIGQFVNIAPIAKDTSFQIQHGTDQKIDVNLLQFANDDGDGLASALIKPVNKPKFYVNDKGEELPIRIGKNVDPVLITAERQGPCPGLDKKYTCYGGKMQVQIKNALDPFSYKFTYFVYDADGLVSNEATVTLNNSATAPNSVRNSGGGSFGWLSLFGLAGLVGYRRYQDKKLMKKS